MLGDAQIERYSRQIILPQVGGRGQEKILRSRVYVDGDGLLAATALLYLAAAGVGTIGIARSRAAPVFSALAEQSLEPDEQPAAHTLRRLNPDCTIVVHPDEDEHPTYDLVLATTAALHDGWYARHKPFVWGTARGEDARLFVSRGDRADWPCLRCLFSASSLTRGAETRPQQRGRPSRPSALFAIRALCGDPTRHRSPENHPPARGGPPAETVGLYIPGVSLYRADG